MLSQFEIYPYLILINSLFYLPLPTYLHFEKIKSSVDKSLQITVQWVYTFFLLSNFIKKFCDKYEYN